jgi:hypothetical protein
VPRKPRVPDLGEVIRAICHTPRRQRLLIDIGGATKWTYVGEARDGRFLVAIAEELAGGARPITCWSLVGRKRVRYLAWRQTGEAVDSHHWSGHPRGRTGAPEGPRSRFLRRYAVWGVEPLA